VVEFLGATGDEAAAGECGRAMVRSLDLAMKTISLALLAPAPALDAEAICE
jgi:hypothetical protein